MAAVTTYTNARANLKALCDEAASSREPVIIRRRGADDVVLISAAELRSLLETAHLLRSPKNAERLRKALTRALGGKTRPRSETKLRRDLGLDEESGRGLYLGLERRCDRDPRRARRACTVHLGWVLGEMACPESRSGSL